MIGPTKKFRSIFFLSIILLLTACVSDDLSEISNINVQGAKPVRRNAENESFPLPNCGGTGRLSYTLGTQLSVQKTVIVAGTATVRGGIEAGLPILTRQKLEAEVSATYEQNYSMAVSRLDTILMEAAPGTQVNYIILWEEQEFAATVSFEGKSGSDYETPYTYVLRVPKINDSKNITCPTGSPTVTPTDISATPTLTLVPASTLQSVSDTDTPPPPDDTPTSVPTNTPVPQPTDTLVPIATNTASPTLTSHQCIQSESYTLLSSWTTAPVFLESQSGEVKTFSHCPPGNSVQYNSIAVDDQLIRVEKVCGTSTVDVSNDFVMFTVDGELLPHYRSTLIDLSPDCRIDFIIQDTIGEKIGLIIKSSEPGILHREEPTAAQGEINSNLPLKVCGENAFSEDSFVTTKPLFKRPEGYNSGWITSDPSKIVLPDGSVREIAIRYVLVVESLPELQLQDVSLGNIWGCWLRADVAGSIMDDTSHEFERMKEGAPNAVTGIFQVSADGLQEIMRQ